MEPSEKAQLTGRFQPPEVRRRQILDAAARLAVDAGLAHTSIAMVAEAAGIAKGSIYLHFASRQELLAALQADLWTHMLERPAEIIADRGLTWTEKLDAVIEHWMRFEIDSHELYHAVFHAVASETEEPFEAARTLLAEIVDEGSSSGEFDLEGLDPQTVVEFLLHAYSGACLHHTDALTTIVDIKKLFRRVVGATPQVR
ncbi:TetR/AcrR family transcriptional regulator [Salinibacterium sp. M195]|uniref:TetR/AcrR family transcriptional regulator n=1 Tax=Salinibacterium sp. M195 TaxID=2583374 RepID=UPI001C629579|nr:TetR/AcrR family transcriptional regulator [Salinibacterium sp. M195]